MYLSEVDSPPKLKSAVVKVTPGAIDESCNSETVALAVTELPKRDLFPVPPRKINDQPSTSQLIDVDLFNRKPSSRGKHSSNYRKNVQATENSRAIEERILQGAINRARHRLSERTAVKRAVQFTLASNGPAIRNRQSSTRQPKPQQTVFSRLEPSSSTSAFRIPRKRKDVGTQTDLSGQCKCAKRGAKNRNRRAAFIQNRDIIKKLKLDATESRN